MIIAMFLLLILLFAITDARRNEIANIVIIPAIFIGCAFTHNWLWAAVMFVTALSITFADFKCNQCGGNLRVAPYALGHERLHVIAGGDTKLFTMIAAFIGWKALMIFAMTMGILYFKKAQENTAVAPYAFVSSILILAITYLAKGFAM